MGAAAVTGPRYDLLRVIGKGGFGTVYQAEVHGEGDFRKLVAIKVLHPRMAEDPELASRLRDEARVLGVLRHRAIVHVEGLVKLQGRWAVVMEFVEGVDLHKLIGRGRVPVGPAVEIVREAATALEVAWSRPTPGGESLHLLHRDIKPSNIRLTPAGEVKVLDFGIARADLATREADGGPSRYGTQGYLSPERLDGSGEGHASDVFALAVVLYELVAGRRLGQPGLDPGLFYEHVEEALEAVKPVDPGGALTGVLREGLAYEAADRPDAAGLARQLRGLRQQVEDPWLYDWAAIWVPRVMAEPAGRDAGLTQLASGADTLPDLSGSAWTAALDGGEELDPVEPPTATTVVPPSTSKPWRWPWAVAGAAALAAGLALVATPEPEEEAAEDTLPSLVTEVSADEEEDQDEAPSTTPAPTTTQTTKPATTQRSKPRTTRPSSPSPPRRTTAPAPDAEARVKVSGDARGVVLVDGSKRRDPGRVPAGSYSIEADFGDGWVGAGTLRLVEGQEVTLHCDGAFFQCRVR